MSPVRRWRTRGCIVGLVAAGCTTPERPPAPPIAYEEPARGGAASLESKPQFLDPNLATAAALTAIPGMTDSIALAVIAARPYTSMLGVDTVLKRHLSDAQRDSTYTRLWIPLDVNTASSDEILLIPGVDARVRHELEHYRPYADIDDFRRRFGGRVARTEVARLERYLTVQ